MKKNKIKAFTFDTGGTVLDWHTGFKKGFESIIKKYDIKKDSVDLANKFRKLSLEKVTNQNQNDLINFDEAHKEAIKEIFTDFSITISNEDLTFLSYEVPSKLEAWPDFLRPFNTLREKYLCVSFTLLSNRLVFLNSKRNKINWDLILSCETLEVYKPNVEAYKKTARMLQLEPEECVMVACHSFDLNAAQKAGFNTLFVKRALEWGNNTNIVIDANYDMVINKFEDLLSLV